MIKAIEFFSGMGAFSEAARDSNIEVVQAFDQNEIANKAFVHNFGFSPSSRNLDSVRAEQIQEADLWWMSPPCTPYSRRGSRRDASDPRARSILNLIGLLERIRPTCLIVENVSEFTESSVYRLLTEKLEELEYKVRVSQLCSTVFGVPMARPRVFISARLSGEPEELNVSPYSKRMSLGDYLLADCDLDESLLLDDESFRKYESVLNVVDPTDVHARLICFTRNYYSCRKASGSMIRRKDGKIRFVSPTEILHLMGYSREYRFPDSLGLEAKLRLLGNSVDVRAIRALISAIC